MRSQSTLLSVVWYIGHTFFRGFMDCQDPSNSHTGPINTASGQKVTCALDWMELKTFLTITRHNTIYNQCRLGIRTPAFVPKVGSLVNVQGRVWSSTGYNREMATVLQVNRSTVKVSLVLPRPGPQKSNEFYVDFYSIVSPNSKIPHMCERVARIKILP